MKTNMKKLLSFSLKMLTVLALVASCFTCLIAMNVSAESAAPTINMRYPDGKAKAFTMSFDDGYKNDARFVQSFLNYGLKATFYLSTGYIGGTSSSIHATMDDAVALYANTGMEIGSHTVNHQDLPTIYAESGDEGLASEITADINALEAAFGTDVIGMAYPGAPPYKLTDDNVINFLKNVGIGFARTAGQETYGFDLPADWYRWHPSVGATSVDKVKELGETFVNMTVSAEPKLFYVWGHAYDIDNKWGSYSEFDAFAQSMSGKDDIWYATNGEVYSYINAYNQMTVSVEADVISNPTATDLWFEYDGEIYKVAAGETLEGLFTDVEVNVTIADMGKTIDVIVKSDCTSDFVVTFTQNGVDYVKTEYAANGAKSVFSFTTDSDADVEIKVTAGEETVKTVVCQLARFDGAPFTKYVQYIDIELGDANGDGMTDVKDLVRAKKIIAEVEAATADADVSGDGAVTVGDLTAIAKLIVAGKTGLQGVTVTFEDEDGTVLETVTVPAGFKAAATFVPTKDGYGFAGWSADTNGVTENITVTATYGEVLPDGSLEGTIPEDWELGD